MDVFDKKGILPMLISEMWEPYDDEDSIFELKLDGIRCLAYIDEKTDLRNKRDMKLLPRFPELKNIHQQCKKKCILDGELIVTRNGVPDFYEVQKRTLMSDLFKIELSSKTLPASFVAYDILYVKDHEVVNLPLMERKKLLTDLVIESERISVSRYVEGSGKLLFDLAKQQNLEGIVGKKKDSLYWYGKRTKDWIKCKVMADDDFIIGGYLHKSDNTTTFILGKYSGDNLIITNQVTLGCSVNTLRNYGCIETSVCPFVNPGKYDDVTWIEPNLVGTVEYMPSDRESMRQPVFKGIREDKLPKECIVNGN